MIDVSRATLDVIEAIKTKQVVRFDYGNDTIREIKPTGFFGDFDGFEGTDEATDDREFRRYRFDKIKNWLGVKDTLAEIDNLKIALRTAIEINKEAKGLSYPIVDIQVKLSGLAEKHGLEDEMEYCLDHVNEQSNKLQSAFFECESVFEEAISELELSLYDD